MLRVPIEQAQPGMILAQPVVSPDKLEHVLLKTTYKLDAEAIARLRQLKVRTIWVKYPQLDVLDELLDPALLEGKQALYGALKEGFSEAVEGGLAKVQYGEYVGMMTSLFSVMLNDHTGVSPFLTELQGKDDDVFAHGISVASVALMLGMRLEAYICRERSHLPPNLATQLAPLGIGCVLHDLGKLELPDELRRFHLAAQDLGPPEWQNHTEAGHQLLKAGLDPTAAQVVLNHHQHFDGSGFPFRKAAAGGAELAFPLTGHDIHIFCRIAAIANRFDDFRFLPDGTIAPPVVALKRLQNPGYQKWFDPVVYDTFLAIIPPFSPGDQLTLSDGQVVAVTAVNERLPCHPVVQAIDPALAVNPKDTNSDDDDALPITDLAGRPDIKIVAAGDFDVTRFLY